MAIFTATHFNKPAISSSQAGQPVIIYDAVAVTTALADNDICKLAKVPAGHVITDVLIDCADLDSSTGLVFDVGILNAGQTDLESSQNFITSSTAGQAAGVVRADVAGGGLKMGLVSTEAVPNITAAVLAERGVGLKVTTVATTEVAGVILAIVTCVPRRGL